MAHLYIDSCIRVLTHTPLSLFSSKRPGLGNGACWWLLLRQPKTATKNQKSIQYRRKNKDGACNMRDGASRVYFALNEGRKKARKQGENQRQRLKARYSFISFLLFFISREEELICVLCSERGGHHHANGLSGVSLFLLFEFFSFIHTYTHIHTHVSCPSYDHC